LQLGGMSAFAGGSANRTRILTKTNTIRLRIGTPLDGVRREAELLIRQRHSVPLDALEVNGALALNRRKIPGR
jgi:hypothetical protein